MPRYSKKDFSVGSLWHTGYGTARIVDASARLIQFKVTDLGIFQGSAFSIPRALLSRFNYDPLSADETLEPHALCDEICVENSIDESVEPCR